MAITEHRAGQLAQLAYLDQLALPAAVATAISGFEAIMALRSPGMPERGAVARAITSHADKLARQAMLGKNPVVPAVPLDVAAVTRARQDEQDALDRADLARELREAAAAVLCQMFDGSSGQQVIGALQERHREVMAELVGHARKLPAGASDAMALEAGGQVRESYLAARDLAGLVTRLREAVGLIEGPPDYMPDDLERCLAYERTGKLYTTAWLAPSGVSTHGPLGTFEFYLSAAREDYEWWLPASGELDARAAKVRQQMHARRVRGGLDPAHVF